MTTGDDALPPGGFDVTQPNIARVYDYLLGGKDNFAADRTVGDRIKKALPEVGLGVAQQRAVLRRAVRYLVDEAGIRQLVDIGSGLPTAGNVHEVAQAIEPATQVVYVDNDPVVLTHARALLADNETTLAIDADLRRPRSILENSDLRQLIDFDQPVGLLLCGILHHILDEEDPWALTAELFAAMPTGSHLFIHHLRNTGEPDVAEAQAALRKGLGRGQFRSTEQIERFFAGLDPVPPGVVLVPDWRPEPGGPSTADNPVLRLAVAGVARKP